MSFRNKIKRILGPVIKPAARWYFSKPRSYRYKTLEITVMPGVFHPHLIISTKLLLEFLEGKNLAGKHFLELGCGSGIVAVQAAKNGGIVTASDISLAAVENAKINAEKCEVKLNVVASDLFENLSDTSFDVIVINPPYYPVDPSAEIDHAWYCGAEFQYFERLFAGLQQHLNDEAEVIMILSEDCQLEKIQSIAHENGLAFVELHRQKVMAEWNFIFSIHAK
jgi:release factor glutamine methyltransferase